MPGVPMEMPSDTVMVLNSTLLPPAASMPAQASRASSPMCMLQGVTLHLFHGQPGGGAPPPRRRGGGAGPPDVVWAPPRGGEVVAPQLQPKVAPPLGGPAQPRPEPQQRLRRREHPGAHRGAREHDRPPL